VTVTICSLTCTPIFDKQAKAARKIIETDCEWMTRRAIDWINKHGFMTISVFRQFAIRCNSRKVDEKKAAKILQEILDNGSLMLIEHKWNGRVSARLVLP